MRSARARRWGKYPAEVETRSRGRRILRGSLKLKGSDTPSIACGSSKPTHSSESKPNILVRRGARTCPGHDYCIGRHQSILFDVDPVKSVARGYPLKRVPHVFIDSSAFKRSRRIGSPSSWHLSAVASLASKKTCLGSFLPDESHALTCETGRIISHKLRCGSLYPTAVG